MPDIPRDEVLARRTIDHVFAQYGRTVSYHSKAGRVADVQGKFSVSEREESLEGGELEMTVRGFQLRFRIYELDEYGIKPALGDKVELNHPFRGHSLFHLDGAPMIWGRRGLQWICGVTPSENLTVDPDNQNPLPASDGLLFE